MSNREPICFELFLKENSVNSGRSNLCVLAYEGLINSLIQSCGNLTFSMRHFYDPLASQKLRSFILINPSSRLDDHETSQKIEGLLRGSLSRFYSLTRQLEGFEQLSWVSSISELLKEGRLVDKPEFTGYLPYFFSAKLSDNEFRAPRKIQIFVRVATRFQGFQAPQARNMAINRGAL